MFPDRCLRRGRFLRFNFGWRVKELQVFEGVFVPRRLPEIPETHTFEAAPVLRPYNGAQRARGRLACACGCARVHVRALLHVRVWACTFACACACASSEGVRFGKCARVCVYVDDRVCARVQMYVRGLFRRCVSWAHTARGHKDFALSPSQHGHTIVRCHQQSKSIASRGYHLRRSPFRFKSFATLSNDNDDVDDGDVEYVVNEKLTCNS